jgi:hypothetical protein
MSEKMPENKDLVHILKLLDDESPKVRDRVWEKLEANLSAWEPAIRARLGDITPPLRKKVLHLLTINARSGFRGAWLGWRLLTEDMEKLEAALSGLSFYLSGLQTVGLTPRHPNLAPLLDGLAQDFRNTEAEVRPETLADFLFIEKGLRGADNDYYDPANSDLVQVIENGRGIPITLACVFMLVGYRLGLDIAGCDVPEHFLTRARHGNRDIIIDCFDGGRVLDIERLDQLEQKYAPDFSRLLRSSATPEAIVARVLRNLINAYHLTGNKTASEFMWTLADDLRLDREGPDDLEDLEDLD